MGAAWTRRPGAPVPEPFPGRADREAAYRPLPNAGVTMDGIPEPHLEATVERRRLEPVILAVQDTTTLNHATLAATSGPDGPGGGGKGTDGIPAHRGVAPGGTGRPLGPFTPGADFRRRPDGDSARRTDGLRRAGRPQGARRHADAALRWTGHRRTGGRRRPAPAARDGGLRHRGEPAGERRAEGRGAALDAPVQRGRRRHADGGDRPAALRAAPAHRGIPQSLNHKSLISLNYCFSWS